MRVNASASTGKSSKQMQHGSASLCGYDDPAEEDDEVELASVNVVSFALQLVALEVESIRCQRSSTIEIYYCFTATEDTEGHTFFVFGAGCFTCGFRGLFELRL